MFAQRFKELRLEKQLKQSEIAIAIGVSQATVSDYESGKIEPTLKMLTTISNFFNVSADYLLGRIDEFGNEIKQAN